MRQTVEVEDVDLAIASVASLGLMAPAWWPTVAVELLLLGDERSEVAQLAGMPTSSSYWAVEPMASKIVEQAGPVPAREVAISTLVGLLAQSFRAEPCAVDAPMIRTVASLADSMDYPDALMDAFLAEEFLDCDCHEPDTDGVEARLMAHPSLAVPDGLAVALTAHARRRYCPVGH